MKLSDSSGDLLYRQVKDRLGREIMEGRLGVDGSLPSMRQICDDFDVSITTVHRAIKEMASEGLLTIRRRKGISVSSNGRKMIAARLSNLTIGITFLDIYNSHNPYLAEVIRSIGQTAHDMNFNCQVFTTPTSELTPESHPLLWKNLRDKNIDGLILTSRMPIKDIARIQEEQIPFLLFNDDIPFEEINSVTFDEYHALSTCLSHLRNHGHRRIGLIQFWWGKTTMATYQDKLEELQLDTNPKLIKTASISNEEEEAVTTPAFIRELLDMKERPTALIIDGGTSLAVAVRTLRELDMNIPQDMAVVGICVNPKYLLGEDITVAGIPVAEMAKAGAEILLKNIRGESLPQKLVVKPEWRVGTSCGCKRE